MKLREYANPNPRDDPNSSRNVDRYKIPGRHWNIYLERMLTGDTYREIGDRLGVSSQIVSQICKKTEKRLARLLRCSDWEPKLAVDEDAYRDRLQDVFGDDTRDYLFFDTELLICLILSGIPNWKALIDASDDDIQSVPVIAHRVARWRSKKSR